MLPFLSLYLITVARSVLSLRFKPAQCYATSINLRLNNTCNADSNINVYDSCVVVTRS